LRSADRQLADEQPRSWVEFEHVGIPILAICRLLKVILLYANFFNNISNPITIKAHDRKGGNPDHSNADEISYSSKEWVGIRYHYLPHAIDPRVDDP
jgi:hypothetical protein